MILYRGGCRSAQLALKTVKFHAIRPSIRTSVRRYLSSEHAESSVEPVPHPIEYGPAGSFTLECSGALDLDIQANHSELLKLLKEYREKSQDVPLDRIFELYYSIPSPRVCYLTRFTVRRILTILSRQNNLLSSIANRYFIVIKDMQSNQTRIRLTEWSGMID